MGWTGGRDFEVGLFNCHSRLPIEGVSSSSPVVIEGCEFTRFLLSFLEVYNGFGQAISTLVGGAIEEI